jgi:hypothetical protein
MAPAEYLSTHDIEHYFSDALALLIKLRLQSPPQLKIPAALYLAKYFISVREGRHVLFREYRYITSTDHSRRSFTKWFQHCLEPLTQHGGHGATHSIADYYNLLTLMCKDFPLAQVKSAAAMLLVEDGLECLVSVTDFITAFKLQLIHGEFLDRTEAVFGSYQAASPAPSKDGFLEQLGPLCQNSICTISIDMLREAIDPINEDTEVLDIFNCLVRSDAIRRLNDAPGLQPRAAGFFS